MREMRRFNVAPCSRGDQTQSRFAKRWQALYSHWCQHKDEMWGSADFFAIATPPRPSPSGDTDNNNNIGGYLKSSTFNRWLLGYEFPETLIVFGNKKIHFLCGHGQKKKNASLLKSVKRLAKGAVDVDVIIYSHRRISKKMDDVIHIMRTSNDAPIPIVVGYIAKESSFPKEKWADKLKNCGLELSDVTYGLSHLLANEENPDEVTRQKNEEIARRLALGGTKLVLLTENKPISLSYVYIHPPFGGQPGELEAHANGFRYSTRDQLVVDILYANIKHAFFLSKEYFETISLIHFDLHNHIMVGDKKTKYVQFSIESMHFTQTVEGEKIWNFDAIEIRDRKYHNECNFGKTDFQYFVTRVEEQQPQLLKFERGDELGFTGTIAAHNNNRTKTYFIATSRFLIEPMFTPFLVIPFSEIEIVNLERVGFSGQTDFDMAIVFKDFKRDVMHIDFICYHYYYLGILEWLDRSGVQYFETRVNVHWRAIMKTFTDDPQAFIDVGGWDFLNREKEIIFIDNHSGGGFVNLDPAETDFWPNQYSFALNDRNDSDSDDYYSGLYSVPKQRRLKKKVVVFSKLRAGLCFSASRRRKRSPAPKRRMKVAFVCPSKRSRLYYSYGGGV